MIDIAKVIKLLVGAKIRSISCYHSLAKVINVVDTIQGDKKEIKQAKKKKESY